MLRCAVRDGAVHRGSVSGKRWSVALSPLKAAASRVPADPLLFTLLVWPSRRLPRPSELIPVSRFTNQRNPENNAADRATRLYLGRNDGNCRLLFLLLNCIVSREKRKVNMSAGCVDSNLCYQYYRGKYFKFFSFLLLFVCRICLSFCQ